MLQEPITEPRAGRTTCIPDQAQDQADGPTMQSKEQEAIKKASSQFKIKTAMVLEDGCGEGGSALDYRGISVV
jgi:hypothetical protein